MSDGLIVFALSVASCALGVFLHMAWMEDKSKPVEYRVHLIVEEKCQ